MQEAFELLVFLATTKSPENHRPATHLLLAFTVDIQAFLMVLFAPIEYEGETMDAQATL